MEAKMETTLKYKITEAVVTHPHDTIRIQDIMEQLPKPFNEQTVRVSVSKNLVKEGYLKSLGREYRPRVYKILKRDLPEPKKSSGPYKPRSTSIYDMMLKVIDKHPSPTITLKEFRKALPDVNMSTMATYCGKQLKNAEILKSSGKVGIKGGAATYKILKRQPEIKGDKLTTKVDLEPQARPASPKDEISFEELGEKVYRYMNFLKQKVHETSSGYSHLQDEMRKEKEANRLVLKEKDKILKEQEDVIKHLKERIKALHKEKQQMAEASKLRTFKLGELLHQSP